MISLWTIKMGYSHLGGKGKLYLQNKCLSDALNCKVIAEKAKQTLQIRLPGCSNIVPSLLCSTAFTLNMLDAAGIGNASTNIYTYIYKIFICILFVCVHICTYLHTWKVYRENTLSWSLKTIFHKKEFLEPMDTCSYTDTITFKNKWLLPTVIQFKGLMQPVFTVFPLHKSMILKTNK